MILTTEPTKGGRISLFADGEYIMSIDSDIWYSLSYTDFSEISEDELQEIKTLALSRLAYAQALRFLTLRAHSAHELYNKLIKKHSPESAANAVDKCRELGFIDDFEFARSFANELASRKHYGASRIRQELHLKGIDREICESVIAELDIDYNESIVSVIEKKYKTAVTDEKVKNRAIAGLMRLGFSYSDIKQAFENFNISEDGFYND